MDGGPEFPGEMRLALRLRADRCDRLVRVSAGSRIQWDEPPQAGGRRRQIEDVVPVFAAAVDAGLFPGPKEGQRATVLNALAVLRGGPRLDEWEIMTPPLDVEAFVVLARMFWAVGGAAVEIKEAGPDEQLTIRAADQVPTSTVRIPPWAVERHLEPVAKNARVTVVFERSIATEIVLATSAVLRAWGALASFGAFTGGKGVAPSAAVPHDLQEERQREVSATFETLAVGPDGWGSLWAGLLRIHRRAPIARVEVQ